MQQYFGYERKNNIINLNEKDFNHIKNVMRMKSGEEVFVVIDNKRFIASLNEDLKSVTIKEELNTKTNNKEIILYVPFLQDDKMSMIFQKATELGVTKFVVVDFIRCKYKIDKDKKSKKLDRWRKIIVEAAEQSYRNEIPLLEDFIESKDIKSVKGMNIICSLDTKRVKNINQVLNPKSLCDKITIVFGPEGGFEPGEEERIVNSGFERVCLGKNVLRTETAPLYVISIIKYLEGSE